MFLVQERISFIKLLLFCCLQLLRDEFYFSPKITKAQFFGSGFAEQKAILTSQIFKMMMKKHSELQKRSRLESKLAVRKIELSVFLLYIFRFQVP